MPFVASDVGHVLRPTWQCIGLRALLVSLIGFAFLIGIVTAFPSATYAADQVEVAFLYRTGKYAECIDSAQEVLDDNGLHEPCWVWKIRAELELGRYADALASLDASLMKLPMSIQLRWLGRDVCHFNQQSERATKLQAEMVALLQQSAWRYTDAANQVVVGRWMLSERVDPKKVLTGIYKEVLKRQPSNVDIRVAMGDLALDKQDFQLASEAYLQAAKIDKDHPDVQFGIAQAFAPSDSERAEQALQNALKVNPQHVPSLLMIVDEHIDAERYDEAQATLKKVDEINPKHPLALAYKAVIAHLHNKPEDEQLLRAAALAQYTKNPAVDHLIGRKLSQKYRFAEGAEYQRQSLAFDPQSLAAKQQLAQDLLRLGQEEAGLKLAEEVYTADAYNIFAHNLVTLQENLAKFRTLEADGLMVRMDAREADIYGQRVLELLQRAKQELCAKYDIELTQPVIVELFPRQEDFAIRTFGLPGGAGFLGVCFGTVITANSPASQGTSPACWEATLWHEFCHVVTLNKTKNKMPRWLSEGISVYEEGLEDPAWGQALSARYREMILGEDLTPVSKLSGAFLQPKSALHLQFAYFESAMVVEYLVEKYGQETLQRILVDLGAGLPINESLQRYAGSLDALDAEFAAFAKKRTEELAPDVDWATPELGRGAKPEEVAQWVADHPTNYAGLKRLAQQEVAAEKWADAKATLEKMRKLFPRDSSAGNPYLLLAKVYRETKEPAAEREMLVKLAEMSANDPGVYERLCELAVADDDWEAARKYALAWLAVNPLVAAPHRQAAAAAEKLNDHPLAVASYQAILALAPFDLAAAHFQLAQALHRQGDQAAAKKHVLYALEETPRYRAAQQLLLQLVQQETPDGEKTPDSPAPAAPPVPPADAAPATETQPATPPADAKPAAAAPPVDEKKPQEQASP